MLRVPSGETLGCLRTGLVSITHVRELQTSGHESLLVLACRDTDHSSIVAVFSPGSSQLLRAIRIQHQITSMCVLSAGRLDAPGLFSDSQLTKFMGVVAVGCKNGRVILVDLALGKDWEPVKLVNPGSAKAASIRTDSLTTHMMHPEEEHVNFVVELTETYIRRGKFHYTSPDNTLLHTYSESESVTILLLHPQPRPLHQHVFLMTPPSCSAPYRVSGSDCTALYPAVVQSLHRLQFWRISDVLNEGAHLAVLCIRSTLS